REAVRPVPHFAWRPRAPLPAKKRRPASMPWPMTVLFRASLTRLVTSRQPAASPTPMDANKVANWKFPEIEHAYTEKDTILYALGLGCGTDPSEPDDLKYVYEKGLVALPTMP